MSKLETRWVLVDLSKERLNQVLKCVTAYELMLLQAVHGSASVTMSDYDGEVEACGQDTVDDHIGAIKAQYEYALTKIPATAGYNMATVYAELPKAKFPSKVAQADKTPPVEQEVGDTPTPPATMSGVIGKMSKAPVKEEV